MTLVVMSFFMASACSQEQKLVKKPKMYQPIFEITPEIEQHFDSPLRVKAEATVEAIALSKSISSATAEQQVELAKASGWGTLTDIWVKANHQGNTWQHRCYEKLSQLLTQAEIQAAKSATATAYQTSFEVIRAMWDILSDIGFIPNHKREATDRASSMESLPTREAITDLVISERRFLTKSRNSSMFLGNANRNPCFKCNQTRSIGFNSGE